MKRPVQFSDLALPVKRRARTDREGPVQTSIVTVIRAEFPRVDVFSTLNGARLRPAVRAKMKREGLKAGIVDLYVCWDGGDGWLEVKLPGYTPSDVTDEQKAFIARQLANGRNAAVVSSAEEARAVLLSWGAPRFKAAA